MQIPLELDLMPLNKPLTELNVGAITIDTLLKLYFTKMSDCQELTQDLISDFLLISYSLVLTQISAKLVYEESSYNIKNPGEVFTFQNLLDLVKNKDLNLTVSGQSVDIETKFIEGSLSFLRKAVATVIIITGLDEGEDHKLPSGKSTDSTIKYLKKLSNASNAFESKTELSMLMNIMGWLKDEINDIDFYAVIEQVLSMPESDEYGVKQFQQYFKTQFEGNNSMETDQEDVQMTSEDEEEQKIDTSSTPITTIIKRDPSVVPEILYLTTPDFYFTLPKLPETLENLTKKYYNKK